MSIDHYTWCRTGHYQNPLDSNVSVVSVLQSVLISDILSQYTSHRTQYHTEEHHSTDKLRLLARKAPTTSVAELAEFSLWTEYVSFRFY
jgi:hypothetical protein